ncbi:MAG: hypothetical protein M5U26_16095 [Planctomycetota bacterium]|nr:hypothetical protein [Planctomycetota bacterium]
MWARCWTRWWGTSTRKAWAAFRRSFDAEAPHAPRGCFAQAWSVAELLRARRKLMDWSRTR